MNEDLSLERVPQHVYVLGLDYLVRDTMDWSTAVTRILMGKATPFAVHPTRRIRSASGDVDMAWPLMIRLNYWTKSRDFQVDTLESPASRMEILRRDKYTCGYCWKKGNASTHTIDHVYPESRGGKNTWGNLITACKPCNGKKRDRTPEEAGMPLLWEPYVGSDVYAQVQEQVWRILEETGGFVEEALLYEGIIGDGKKRKLAAVS